jgi:hypothetical protein
LNFQKGKMLLFGHFFEDDLIKTYRDSLNLKRW